MHTGQCQYRLMSLQLVQGMHLKLEIRREDVAHKNIPQDHETDRKPKENNTAQWRINDNARNSRTLPEPSTVGVVVSVPT